MIIEREGDGNNQIVNYGGDSGKTEGYRKGVLYFYHNTLVSTRKSAIAAFRLSSPEETVECHGNIFHVALKGKNLSLMAKVGVVKLGKNWLSAGWVQSVDDFTGSIQILEPSVQGVDPGFIMPAEQDFSLNSGSVCLGAALSLPPGLPAPNLRYLRHQRVENLPSGVPLNLGAQ